MIIFKIRVRLLGKKQNGLALNDVILPAWSKNDCREFIRIHRMVNFKMISREFYNVFIVGIGKVINMVETATALKYV